MSKLGKSIAAKYKNTCAVQYKCTVWVYKFKNDADVKKFISGYNLTPSGGDSSLNAVLVARCSLYKEYRTKLGLKFWLRKVYYKFL